MNDPDMLDVLENFENYDMNFYTRIEKGRLGLYDKLGYIFVEHPKLTK
jgi:hypothetical protein